MSRDRCDFCGRDDAALDGGHGLFRSPFPGGPAICCYCARRAVRAFGEVPDPQPATPIPIFRARGWSRRSDDNEPEPAA